MKRTLSLILMVSTTMLASAAYAAPVFMLQFGSFENQDEAQKKLDALKSKHAGVFSRMDLSVREVTLPPDNLTVYRTQAGPLATRADAQSVCSQLASNGDECYVVETAMLAPTAPAKTQVAAAEPAPAPVAEAPKAVEPAPKEEPQVAQAPAPVPAEAPAPVTTAPALVTAAPMSPPPQSIPAIGRDPKNMAALNSVTPSPVTAGSTAADNAAAEQAAADMHRELAEASAPAPQPSPFAASSVGTSPATTKTQIAEAEEVQEKTKDRTLWQRMFGSDEETPKAAAKPKLVEAAPVAAPVDSVTTGIPVVMPPPPAPAAQVQPVSPPVVAANSELPWQTATAAPAPMAPPAAEPSPMSGPTPVMASPDFKPTPAPIMAAPEPAPAPQPQPIVNTPPVITEAQPFPLPPPPAPLVGKSRPAPAPTAMTVPAPEPVGVTPLAGSNVRVEEAKRVPLTQAPIQQFPATPIPSSASIPAAAPQPMPPAPSATVGQKTLWTEIGSFGSQQEALAWWDSYRRAHPDFPVVRVRVTTPLMAAQRGIEQVNLRVGPFARSGFIDHLCDEIEDMPDNVYRCGMITDTGIASSRDTRRGLLPQSRYNR